MTKLATVIADIKETVAPLMEKWVEDRVTFVMDLKAYAKNLDNDPEFNESYERLRGSDRYYSKSSHSFNFLARKGYNKGDIMMAKYQSYNDIVEKMKKDAANRLKKIDVAVVKKINFDVNSVEKLYLTQGKDGFFEGAWKLNNEKTFSFDTFYAGGYNIQCFHVRTKYKLKS